MFSSNKGINENVVKILIKKRFENTNAMILLLLSLEQEKENG